ncbi:MAG TPA: DUF58 domain-containing protein [Methylomirabilota bacterium]|nr:DUF58 domain-containing protein [Methylomirabilota bacterium]
MLRRFVHRSFHGFAGWQHTLSRRLTPAGQLLAAGLLAAVIVGPNTRLTVTYQAVTFLGALLLVALAGALRRPPRLSVRRRLPRFATVGEPLTYTLRVVNPGPRAEPGLALLEDLGDPRPTLEEFATTADPDEARRNRFDRAVGYPRWAWLLARNRRASVAELALPTLPPGGAADVRLTLMPLHRGRVTFRGTTVARREPLGLARALRPLAGPETLLILPRRYPLPPMALPGTRKYQRGGIALATSVGDSQEFVALRDYRPGDPLKRIHWRSWARTGRPVVREYQDEFFVRHAIVLDTFAAAPTVGFEEAVSVAASFACTAGTQDSLLDLLFVGPDAYSITAGRSVGHVDHLLEMLAAVRPCRDRPFAALARLVLERQASLSGAICILLAWDEARRQLVDRLRALGTPTLVLLVTPPGGGASLPPAVGVHRLEVGRVGEGLARL